MSDDLARLQRQLARERRAREEAERLLEDKARELHGANAQLKQVLGELEDRVREQTAELRRALDEAQRASRVKSDFLAMVSHEIRTPMNVVQGMAEMLLDSELLDRERGMVRSILDSCRALLVILNDLLDLSQIEAGKLALERVRFSLHDLVERVAASFRTKAQGKGLDLRLDLPGGDDLDFRGDPGRLRQVLVNLVGNAIKYTDRGGVTLRVVREAGRDGIATVRISIIDTGHGLDTEQQARLFEMFSRVPHPDGRAIEGAGLGLALSRQLVDLMGGDIGVASRPGEGAEFWVVLPFDEPEPALAATEPARPAPGPGRALEILVAEDNPANQAVVKLMLEKLGHRVTLAGDGAGALAALEQRAYDLVLMDLRMPGMGGIEATRAIRALDGAAGGVPVVALTANVTEADRREAILAGMTGFATKPLSRAELERALAFAG